MTEPLLPAPLPPKKSVLLKVFAGIGVLAVLAAGGWAGYQRYWFVQQKKALRIQSDLLCTSMAIRVNTEIKPSVKALQQIPNSHTKITDNFTITTPELDDEIEKTFAGRDTREKGLGSVDGDYAKIEALFKSMQAKAPETAAKCKSWADTMEKCLPSFPYLNMDPSPDCKEKYAKPAVEELTNYFQRNYKIEAPPK